MHKLTLDIGENTVHGSSTTAYFNAGCFKACEYILEDDPRIEFYDGRVIVNYFDYPPQEEDK